MKMNKKKMLTAAAAALCLAVMAGCGGAPVAGSTSGSASTASSAVAPVASPSGTVSAGIAGGSGNYITEEQARAAALEHAGVAEADAQFLSVRLDYDDGRAEYDVEFLHGTEEYDYTIDALTGEVLSMDRDASIPAAPHRQPLAIILAKRRHSRPPWPMRGWTRPASILCARTSIGMTGAGSMKWNFIKTTRNTTMTLMR